jgi:hypothetical protein
LEEARQLKKETKILHGRRHSVKYRKYQRNVLKNYARLEVAEGEETKQNLRTIRRQSRETRLKIANSRIK